MNAKSGLVLLILLASSISVAHAQGTGVGGTATSGTGVKTGQGPGMQPVAPATSTTNPQQNYSQQGFQRPQNYQGPAQTNPPQQPFGTR